MPSGGQPYVATAGCALGLSIRPPPSCRDLYPACLPKVLTIQVVLAEVADFLIPGSAPQPPSVSSVHRAFVNPS